MWIEGLTKWLNRLWRTVWLVIGCIVHGNPRGTLHPPPDSSFRHFFLPRHGKDCGYCAGLHRSILLGFMSLTMTCFTQNHHGPYARSGKGHWYSSAARSIVQLCAHPPSQRPPHSRIAAPLLRGSRLLMMMLSSTSASSPVRV